jgi:cation diffusion facilitator family transporter
MHHDNIAVWRHDHIFLGEAHDRNERRTWFVVALTLAMMVAEIAGGMIFGSMALLADGWHMSTHAAALGIAALAYRYARKHARDPRFTFGTGKLGELAGFASAIILAVVAALIGYESSIRLYTPVTINFSEATLIAFVGLAVNLLSAWLLFDHGDHGHHHAGVQGHAHDDHDHHHGHGHDGNLRAAYLHVLADAVTSVLAITALVAGRFFGWNWLDPVMGIVGAAIILHWSIGLIRTTSGTLLDAVPDKGMMTEIRTRLESNGDRVSDLHCWKLGPGHTGVIASVVSDAPQPPDVYKARLADLSLSHITIEPHRCGHE